MRYWLRDKRMKADLTQKEIAERLKISRSFYADIERGEKEPKISLALEIAKILNFDVNKFR